MPTLKRLCNHPGCSANAEQGRMKCADHARPKQALPFPRREKRQSASARGYDSKWRRVRAMFLRRHPVCVGVDEEGCNRPAEEVDHIVPLALGGTNKWENLQPLCKSCHSKKTIRENRGAGGRITRRSA